MASGQSLEAHVRYTMYPMCPEKKSPAGFVVTVTDVKVRLMGRTKIRRGN